MTELCESQKVKELSYNQCVPVRGSIHLQMPPYQTQCQRLDNCCRLYEDFVSL